MLSPAPQVFLGLGKLVIRLPFKLLVILTTIGLVVGGIWGTLNLDQVEVGVVWGTLNLGQVVVWVIWGTLNLDQVVLGVIWGTLNLDQEVVVGLFFYIFFVGSVVHSTKT